MVERTLVVERTSTARALALLAVATLFGAPGCVTNKAEPWTPKPLVRWSDVASVPIAPPQGGYRILVDQPTQGLFPADIAVTRVSIEEPDEGNPMERLRLAPKPRNEYLRWNSAFDDLMAVSEVFPIAQRDMGGAEPAPKQILAAFRALRARMGLIYAVNELSEDEVEMIGVLYDARRAKPIAAFQVSAVTIEPPEDKAGDSPDLWETDARALAREAFERIVFDCLREMIAQDEPAVVIEPTGWRPTRTTRPAVWPPTAPPASP